MQNERKRTDAGASRLGMVLVVVLGATVLATAVLAVRTLDAASDTTATRVDPSATGVTTSSTTAPSLTTTTEPTTTTTTESTTTTTTPPTTTTTTTAPPAPTTTVPPSPSYRRGDSGAEVAAMQERLIDLGFWLPGVDGVYGSVTSQAVMAFQKSQGLGRDGIAGPVTLGALETAGPVGPREGGNHIEVDLERQLMFIVRGDRSYVFNTSTGTSGWRTPSGRFEITRQIDGVRRAPLGDLYRPKYFNRGIALHGSPSIPGYPASHGCTRLHDDAVDFIWANGLAPIGTPVWVY